MGNPSETMTTTTAATATATATAKRKKGRPSRKDLENRALLQQQQQHQLTQTNPNPQSPHLPQNPNHHRHLRSTRRIPNLPPEFVAGSDFDSDSDADDDERVQKKVKLVGHLPNSSSFHSFNFSDIDEINAVAEDEKDTKATDTQNGTSMLAAGPTATTTTPLPDKKLLLLILDKLQKKDTRGVFAEPVDPEELPDYHEVIENPMDFGTVRKKLDDGLYSILEQLEDDIYLIGSNAMQYNAPSTIYFRQARSIQELAKKEFETMRQDVGQSEPPPRPRRGRPPGSRNLKKLLESSSFDRSVPESSSDATPASVDDDAVRSSSYNLRRGPSLYRFPRNLETCFDFPSESMAITASASKSVSTKYGKKQYESEECRRETYNLSGELYSGQDPSLLSTFETFGNELIMVGLDSNNSYARSLAQFAADLGPVVQRIVSKKIKSVLPHAVRFGSGWVSENRALSSVQVSPLPEKPDCVYASKLSTYSSEWSSSLKCINGVSGSCGSPFQIQRGTNGFSGGYGSGFHFQEPPKYDILEVSRRMNSSPIDFNGAMNTENDMGTQGMPYWQTLSMQERWDNSYLAEPNVGFPFQGFSSRSSGLQIGSPPQLDLVLQL